MFLIFQDCTIWKQCFPLFSPGSITMIEPLSATNSEDGLSEKRREDFLYFLMARSTHTMGHHVIHHPLLESFDCANLCKHMQLVVYVSFDIYTSVPFKVDTLEPHTVLPIAISCPVVFSWISLMIWNLFPFKVIVVWGKARSCTVPNLGCRGTKSPGSFDVLTKISAQDMIHEQAHCHDEAANHQLPIAAVFWIIWIVFAKECSSLTQNLIQIHYSTCSIILNVIATQYTCSLNSVYHPLCLVQWSHHCSHMHVPVLSSWLPGYIKSLKLFLLY